MSLSGASFNRRASSSTAAEPLPLSLAPGRVFGGVVHARRSRGPAGRCGRAGRRQLDSNVAHRFAADVVDLRLRRVAERLQRLRRADFSSAASSFAAPCGRRLRRLRARWHMGDDVAARRRSARSCSRSRHGRRRPGVGLARQAERVPIRCGKARISRTSSPAPHRATILITLAGPLPLHRRLHRCRRRCALFLALDLPLALALALFLPLAPLLLDAIDLGLLPRRASR